jgi:hypothetical protein
LSQSIVCKQNRSQFILEEPAETFFIYSQKQIFLDAFKLELCFYKSDNVQESDPVLSKPEILTKSNIYKVRLYVK